jgi:hypothetical protein
MILTDVRQYLCAHGRASLTDLSHRFDVEPEALRTMLDVWVGKGRVRRLDAGPACGSCCGCAETPAEVYVWVNDH